MTTVRVRKNKAGITKGEERCLKAFMRISKRLSPIVPTVEEVGIEMGVSKNSASIHLRNLERKGLVKRLGRKSRSLRLALSRETKKLLKLLEAA